MKSIITLVRNHGYILVFVAIAGGIALLADAHRPDTHLASGEGVPPLIVAETNAPVRTVSVLFTGNSVTFVNNLPYMLSRIAGADTNSHLRFEIASDTHAGQSIGEVWRDGKALPLLQSRQWSFVVLQEHSWWVGRLNQIAEMQTAVPLLARAVAANGSQPLLFMTWVKRPGSDWYRSEPEFQNPEYMQQSIDYYTNDVARRANTPVVPVGDYWWKILNGGYGIDLYAKDGTHPGIAGTYLAALLFYRAITNRNVADIGYVPPGLDAGQARTIRSIAAQ